MQVSMISCLPTDDSLPFSSLDILSVLWIIFHDFSSRGWVCSEKCVLQNLGGLSCHHSYHAWWPGPWMGCPCWGAVQSALVLSECLGRHLCGTTLWTSVTRQGMGKQLVQKHPRSLLLILCDLICPSFCVLMDSKAGFRDSWMVEYVCWNKEKGSCEKKHEKLYWF